MENFNIVLQQHLWESNMNKGQQLRDIQASWTERQRENIRGKKKKTGRWSHWHLQFKVEPRIHIHNNTVFPLVTSSLCEQWAELWLSAEWQYVTVCVYVHAHFSFNLYLPRESWQSSVVLCRNIWELPTTTTLWQSEEWTASRLLEL